MFFLFRKNKQPDNTKGAWGCKGRQCSILLPLSWRNLLVF